jgi:hypothetical protein
MSLSRWRQFSLQTLTRELIEADIKERKMVEKRGISNPSINKEREPT